MAGKNQTTRFATPTDQYDSQNPFTLYFSLSEIAQGNTFMLTLDQISGEEAENLFTCIQELNIYTGIDVYQRYKHKLNKIPLAVCRRTLFPTVNTK